MCLLKELINQILTIAQEAGTAILTIYHGTKDIAVDVKADNTPLTQADLVADRLIQARLSALTPHYPVLSEESAVTDFHIRKEWSRYWLVDPLDGTREFIHHTDDFSVNIALIDNQKPILGVVHAPAHEVSYVAAVGVGAFKITADGVWKPIQVRSKPDKLTVVVSRFHNVTPLSAYLQHLGEVIIQPVGSALKPCLIAEGVADLYIRLGPTSEWDTAASQCILELAGGQLFDLSGQSLCYNTKASLLNPAFISVGDIKIDWLDYLNIPRGKIHESE